MSYEEIGNQLGLSIDAPNMAQTLYDGDITLDFDKQATNYILNAPKTKIRIRTSNGNVFLRKK